VSNYQNVERVGLVGFSVANARRVTSRGIEAEVTASPLPGLEVVLARRPSNATDRPAPRD
jgi:outer membrane receptor protein involved in Fe transport